MGDFSKVQLTCPAGRGVFILRQPLNLPASQFAPQTRGVHTSGLFPTVIGSERPESQSRDVLPKLRRPGAAAGFEAPDGKYERT